MQTTSQIAATVSFLTQNEQLPASTWKGEVCRAIGLFTAYSHPARHPPNTALQTPQPLQV